MINRNGVFLSCCQFLVDDFFWIVVNLVPTTARLDTTLADCRSSPTESK